MNVRIIANPVAGGGKGRVMAEALIQALQSRVEVVELILTEGPGDSEMEARKPGADCVVAVGGDGSVNEVINGLADSDARLAILPAGTANVVARELGIPSDPQAVAALIAGESGRWVDVGLHDHRRFMLGAGAGLDAAVAKRVSGQRGNTSNLLKWVRPTIETIRNYAFPRFRVVVDGQAVSDQAQYAIVGNCRYSAGIFPATPKAKIDDGLLDVCVMHDLQPLRILSLLITVWHSSHVRRKDIIYLQGRAVEFHPLSDDVVPLQVDGDPRGNLPAAFGIVPRAVKVAAPARPPRAQHPKD